jgi:hypothetical protein
MKLKTSLLAVILIISAAANQLLQAQTSANNLRVNVFSIGSASDQKSVYETETIYLNGNMMRYTKNDKKKKVGTFARFLKKEFDSCSVEGRNEMANCVKNRKQGAFLLTAGGVMLFGALVAAPVVAPVMLGVAVVGLVPYTIGAVKMNKSRNQMQRAVWLRNRDILARHER